MRELVKRICKFSENINDKPEESLSWIFKIHDILYSPYFKFPVGHWSNIKDYEVEYEVEFNCHESVKKLNKVLFEIVSHVTYKLTNEDINNLANDDKLKLINIIACYEDRHSYGEIYYLLAEKHKQEYHYKYELDKIKRMQKVNQLYLSILKNMELKNWREFISNLTEICPNHKFDIGATKKCRNGLLVNRVRQTDKLKDEGLFKQSRFIILKLTISNFIDIVEQYRKSKSKWLKNKNFFILNKINDVVKESLLDMLKFIVKYNNLPDDAIMVYHNESEDYINFERYVINNGDSIILQGILDGLVENHWAPKEDSKISYFLNKNIIYQNFRFGILRRYIDYVDNRVYVIENDIVGCSLPVDARSKNTAPVSVIFKGILKNSNQNIAGRGTKRRLSDSEDDEENITSNDESDNLLRPFKRHRSNRD